MTSTTSPDTRRRAYWLKTLHEWHWVSSALCLIGMVLFSVTGFTLNHSSQIEARPQVTTLRGKVDDALRVHLEQQAVEVRKARKGKAELPSELRTWVDKTWPTLNSQDERVPGFTWTELERQLASLAATAQSAMMASDLVSATRKQANFKPPEMVLREILCVAGALMDESFLSPGRSELGEAPMT